VASSCGWAANIEDLTLDSSAVKPRVLARVALEFPALRVLRAAVGGGSEFFAALGEAAASAAAAGLLGPVTKIECLEIAFVPLLGPRGSAQLRSGFAALAPTLRHLGLQSSLASTWRDADDPFAYAYDGSEVAVDEEPDDDPYASSCDAVRVLELISASGCGSSLRSLSAHCPVHRLYVPGHYTGAGVSLAIVAAVLFPRLESLSMNGLCITPPGAAAQPPPQYFGGDRWEYYYGSKALEALGRSTLRRLLVPGCTFGGAVSEAVARDFFRSFPLLEELDASGAMALGPAALAAICDGMPRLRRLNLSRRPVAGDAIARIASAHAATLVSLSISNCRGATDATLAAIGSSGASLERLEADCIGTEEGIVAVARALSRTRATRLSLCRTPIGPRGLAAIADAAPNLESLAISCRSGPELDAVVDFLSATHGETGAPVSFASLCDLELEEIACGGGGAREGGALATEASSRSTFRHPAILFAPAFAMQYGKTAARGLDSFLHPHPLMLPACFGESREARDSYAYDPWFRSRAFSATATIAATTVTESSSSSSSAGVSKAPRPRCRICEIARVRPMLRERGSAAVRSGLARRSQRWSGGCSGPCACETIAAACGSPASVQTAASPAKKHDCPLDWT
jgi:hypothetical protein